MTPILFAVPAVFAAVLSFCLVRPVRAMAFRMGAIDLPGPRKIHTQPMARLGSLAVVAAAFVVFAGISFLKPPRIHMLSSELLAGIAAGLIPIFLVSFTDDLRAEALQRRAGLWIRRFRASFHEDFAESTPVKAEARQLFSPPPPEQS
jgi:UDP-GlcNAc:undecaprenyl-phosphate/decaprenyl-phosphate GlcNAc-1-phosphate transferase